jgi:type VI protein secretion system component Hcp
VRKTVLSTVIVSGALLAATASIAASDYFLKIEGVEGEATARSKRETIELQSWSFGAGQAGAAEVRTVMFSVPEPGDASTAELPRICASGRHIKSAVLNSPDGRYKLQDAVITSCALTGNERKYEFTGHVTLMK